MLHLRLQRMNLLKHLEALEVLTAQPALSLQLFDVSHDFVLSWPALAGWHSNDSFTLLDVLWNLAACPYQRWSKYIVIMLMKKTPRVASISSASPKLLLKKWFSNLQCVSVFSTEHQKMKRLYCLCSSIYSRCWHLMFKKRHPVSRCVFKPQNRGRVAYSSKTPSAHGSSKPWKQLMMDKFWGYFEDGPPLW